MWKTTDTLVESTTQTNDNTNLLQLIQEMQAKIDKLSEKSDTAWLTQEKKFYEWPLLVSYKMWDWIPVVSYRSERKDSARPLRYKLPNGEYVDNHYVVLTLADGKETKPIVAADFGRYHTLSEKLPVWIKTTDWYEVASYETKHIKQWLEVEQYIFNTKEYGQLFISPNCIN